jgi:hypothetical protein
MRYNMDFSKLYQANREEFPEAYEKAYGAIVVRKLGEKGYDSSKIQAIMNNYLDDPANEKYIAEFKKLQDVRKACKIEAKLEMGEEVNA